MAPHAPDGSEKPEAHRAEIERMLADESVDEAAQRATKAGLVFDEERVVKTFNSTEVLAYTKDGGNR